MPFKGKLGVKTASIVAHCDLFHPERLTATSFEAAVAAFGKELSYKSPQAVLLELLSAPFWVEVALSAVSANVFSVFQECILNNFPNNAYDFDSSIPGRLLQRLSASLLILPCGRSSDALQQYKCEFERIMSVLLALPNLSLEDEIGGLSVIVRRKGTRRASILLPPDPAMFSKLGVEYPKSRGEVEGLELYLICEAGSILQEYLDTLRRSEFAEAIREAFLEIALPPQHLPEVVNDKENENEAMDELLETQNTETAVSSKDPLIQPTHASLYFDSADGFGEWRILLSTRASRGLREARKKEPTRYDIYMKKIKELSNGMFSADNQKRLTGPGTEIPIFEAKMTGDSRLVYQVDCMIEYDSNVERQVLRIFGIYTHAQLDGRFWDSVSYQMGSKGQEYRKKCIFRNKPVNKRDYVVYEETWVYEALCDETLFPTPSEPAPATTPIRPEDLEELHALLVLEKFVPLSRALLNSILADEDIQHVFAVSPYEKAIIDHKTSCYVLGRSGTGKTTTMLFKMFGIERTWQANCDSMSHPRQIFVTQSRVLASKVEEYFGKLMKSLAYANGSAKDLDQTVKKAMDAFRLVDEDEEEKWNSDLPSSFSQLQDHHFPLFLTYDRLCKLLEADVVAPRGMRARSLTVDSISSPITPRLEGNGLISYHDFLGYYWGHFPQPLTKKLDPALVYSEFLGVIKGSEHTLKKEEGYLDRTTYFNLSHRVNSPIASRRDVVWQLFEAYMKRKRKLGHRDAADRTRNILKHWQENKLSQHKIDFLYVDEAQDNLLIDAFLLRSICRNPDGLFWAGDTAQTIANGGSAFRFNDLKAFLYRVEAELKKGKGHLVKSTEPKVFHLAVNYRSHGGIVSCASSVIRIITQFWPYSIDAMQEESGIIDGLKPVVFSGWDENSILFDQFLSGKGGLRTEFGAQQCILVRNNAARDKLRSEVGNIGLIMTLYESKGLEFDDVLLLNFFEDSTVDLAQWRVILNMLPGRERDYVPCPQFDETRHAGVCAELKFLYVAITRARKNLWIIDFSDKGEPLRTFWSTNNLVNNLTPGSEIPQLTVSSTADEWAESGRSLFRNKKYLQAIHCYERACMRREVAISQAYLLRETARAMPGGSKAQDAIRATAYSKAADAFVECAYRESGIDRLTYYRLAGECYATAKENYKAGQAFFSASEYTQSARYYRKGEHFDEAVKVIQKHNVEPKFAATLIDAAKFYYITSETPEKAVPLFKNIEDRLEYMEDADLDVARASLLESVGRIADAADIHIAEGRPMRALDILLNDQESEASLRRGKEELLGHLWRHMSFGNFFAPSSIDLTAQELLRYADKLDMDRIPEGDRNEFAMFRAILVNNNPSLHQLSVHFLSTDNKAAALLCLDHVFHYSPALQTAPDEDVLDFLRGFWNYLLLLRSASTEPNAHERQGMRRLFALTFNEDDNTYFASAGTHLYTQVSEHHWPCLQFTENGALLSPDQAGEYISNSLSDRLKARVNQHDTATSEMKSFTSCCIHHAVFAGCHRSYCNRQHVDVKTVGKVWYSRRVGVHLLQILVLQTAQALLPSKDRAIQQRLWLSKLYEAMFPPYFSLGSPSIWDRDILPETAKAIDVIRDWLRELVYTINPRTQRSRFLGFFMQANALSKILDEEAFTEYVGRARCMVDLRPSEFMRPPHGDYILNDCVAMTLGGNHVSVARGLLFACHVLEKGLHMDISVFCDYLDQICMVMSSDNRLKRYHGNLNDIMLPRNWLLQLLQRSDQPMRQDQLYGLLAKLLTRLPNILQYLASEDGYMDPQSFEWIFFAGRPVYKHGYLTRQMFVARICKTLSLLAYNTSYRVRDDVFNCIKSSRKPGRRPHHLYAEYFDATVARDLSSLARKSASGSSLDEMVHVFHKPLVPIGLREIPGVRRVVYSNPNDLVPLLENRSTLRANAAEFKPRDPLNAQSAEIGEPEDDGATDLLDGEDEGTDEALVNVTQVHMVSKEEHTAAEHIQRAYRRYLRRKLPRSEKPLVSSRRAIFGHLSKASRTLPSPSPYYLKLFLGPLAHALLVADKAQQWLYQVKRKTKDQGAQVDKIERYRARQTKINDLFKRAKSLQKTLGDPGSQMHQEANTGVLKDHVVLLRELISELPPGSLQEVEDDLRIALKGIVQEPRSQPPTKHEKPSLVMDDLYDMLEDARILAS